jgi:putative copper resistance protein D
MDNAGRLQLAATVGLNLASALLVGGAVLQASRDARGLVRAPVRAAALLGLLANLAFLWWQAAVMADVPLAEAPMQFGPVLGHSRFGPLWALQTAALVGCMAAPGCWRAACVLLFIGARAATSHAGASDSALPMVVDALHLLAASLWAGLVLCTAVGPRWHPASRDDAQRTWRFVAALSRVATVALGLIALSGLFAAWRALGTPVGVTRSAYGQLLAIKLLLVAAAAALGGFNRWAVLPRLRLALQGASAGIAVRRFRRVIGIEAVVLLAVLALAALLAGTEPPG